MTEADERELHRLSEMLREIDGTLGQGSPLREGLQKAGVALALAFIHGLRDKIEQFGTPLTAAELSRLKALNLER